MPGYALAAAGGVVTMRRWRPAAIAAVACTAVLVVLPDLAWGAWGKVSAVRYPPGWSAVAAAINADPRPVAVLPADSMRQFSWAGPAPVLDPLPRWVRADVLTTGDLTISGQTVPGEGGRARAVQELLLAGAPADRLAAAGTGWVVAQLGSRGEMGDAAKTLATLPVVYRDGEIAVYRVDGQSPGATAGQRRAAVAAHLVLVGGADRRSRGHGRDYHSGMAIDPNTTAVVLIEYQNDFTTDGGVLHGAVAEVMDKTDMLANTQRGRRRRPRGRRHRHARADHVRRGLQRDQHPPVRHPQGRRRRQRVRQGQLGRGDRRRA